MPKIAYIDKKFASRTLDLIDKCNQVIGQYSRQGYDLTLRQLYYQMVARDLFPEDRRWRWTGARWVKDPNGTKNAQPNYKWLGSIITDARLAGLVDWQAIVDRMRNLQGVTHWASPWDIMDVAYRSYALDKWLKQPNRVEVWVEKDALSSVIARACRPLDVDYFSCRGYVSISEMWRAAQRLAGYIEDNDQEVTILHLGDHDPSGMDMTRDIGKRLDLLSGHLISIRRIALNEDQIQRYNPPPNPTKLTDARAGGYIAKYGYDSWELDALEPSVIVAAIEDAVLPLRDDLEWDLACEEQKAHKDVLATHRDQTRRETKRWEYDRDATI